MENLEHEMNRMQAPEGIVKSHRDALRGRLATARAPRGTGAKRSVLAVSMVLVLGLTGLTVAYPGWVEDIYRVIVAKEIHIQTDDGKQIHIKAVEMQGPAGAASSELSIEGHDPATITKTVGPDDPMLAEWLDAASGVNNIIKLDAEVTDANPNAAKEQMLVIESTDGGATWIVNGDTAKSEEMIRALDSQQQLLTKTFVSEREIDAAGPEMQAAAATLFELHQNYPNPFNPSTQISFTLKEAGLAKLKVFDLMGREIATLHDGYTAAGTHTVTFEAGTLPTGTYLYTLYSGGLQLSRSMILMK